MNSKVHYCKLYHYNKLRSVIGVTAKGDWCKFTPAENSLDFVVFDVGFVSPEIVRLVFTTLFVVTLVQVFLEMRVDVTAKTRLVFKG